MATFTQRKESKSPKDMAHEQAVARNLAALDYDDAPECVSCGEPFAPARARLGYDVCLDCGEPKKQFAVVPVPKSNYVVASNIEQVRSPYSHKGAK